LNKKKSPISWRFLIPRVEVSEDTEILAYTFIQEYESLQSHSPAIRESAIDKYRKLLVDRGDKVYSRLLLKMLLALRKDDVSEVEKYTVGLKILFGRGIMKILVVEDDFASRRMMQKILAEFGESGCGRRWYGSPGCL